MECVELQSRSFPIYNRCTFGYSTASTHRIFCICNIRTGAGSMTLKQGGKATLMNLLAGRQTYACRAVAFLWPVVTKVESNPCPLNCYMRTISTPWHQETCVATLDSRTRIQKGAPCDGQRYRWSTFFVPVSEQTADLVGFTCK
jgi:hypothetical protein